MIDFSQDNPYDSTARQKRAVSRSKAKQNAATHPKPRTERGRLWFNRYSEARHVACQQMGMRYQPVEAPQTENDLRGTTSPFLANYLSTTAPRSWEIMTDSF